MPKVVVIGGGWAGTAAALSAKKAGADVVLLERTDMLLGTGLVGGIMRNNGRFTATEEMIAMGGGELFQVTDSVARHKNIEFPGHKHATLYDVALVEPAVKKVLIDAGVEVLNPVQLSAKGMDPVRLKQEFGKDLTFWGAGCNTQTTATFGTVEEVAAEVEKYMKIFAPGGGFVFTQIHNIQVNVPPENVVAIYETAKKFRNYPVV